MARKIFINYRREDSRADARGIRDRLVEAFGKRNVFMDVDNLLPGQRFDQVLEKALSECEVLIALIGVRWLEILHRRLTDGQPDFVRTEIAGALAKGILVIPVLVDGARPPAPTDLPPDIRALSLHHMHAITHENFGSDVRALINAIKANSGRRTRRVPVKALAASLVVASLVGGGIWAWQPSNRKYLQSIVSRFDTALSPAPAAKPSISGTEVSNANGIARYDLLQPTGTPGTSKRYARIVATLFQSTPLPSDKAPNLTSLNIFSDKDANDRSLEQEGKRTVYASIYAISQAQKLSLENFRSILAPIANNVDLNGEASVGDRLDLIFECDYHTGVLGTLAFIEINHGGETVAYYFYDDSSGVDLDNTSKYYDESGRTARALLMRRPVQSDKVLLASGFGMRTHPILQISKMHTGADFSGPVGTPILAAGSGKVEKAGTQGEYGNYVRIRHANGYETAYGQLSRIRVIEGQAVRLGEHIGDLGSSGLSTAPHLHYEVLKDGTHVDPLRVRLPKARELTADELTQFRRERLRLEMLRSVSLTKKGT